MPLLLIQEVLKKYARALVAGNGYSYRDPLKVQKEA